MTTPKDTVVLEIPGHPPAKSSNRRIIWARNRPMVISSKKVKDYEKEFGKYIRKQDKVLGKWEGGLCIQITAWMKDRRQDLDSVPKVILDELQRNGVIRNDNQVSELYVQRHIDKENPRVQIMIRAVG